MQLKLSDLEHNKHSSKITLRL